MDALEANMNGLDLRKLKEPKKGTGMDVW